MAGDDLCWLDGGREDGCLQAFHHSGEELSWLFSSGDGFLQLWLSAGLCRGTPNSDLVGQGVAEDGSLARGSSPSFFLSCATSFFFCFSSVQLALFFTDMS